MSLNKNLQETASKRRGVLLMALVNLGALTLTLHSKNLQAQANKKNAATAYKIYGKSTSVNDVFRTDQATLYELEKRKFDKIEAHARSTFLERFGKKERLKKRRLRKPRIVTMTRWSKSLRKTSTPWYLR